MSDAGGIPRVLTIAGSDSGGGAGIQADLKTFTALKAFGMSAITSITAQNTMDVRGIHDLPPEFVALQIDTVAQDIGVDAAKTGMLSNSGIIEAVVDSIRRNQIRNIVVDPVMISKSGAALLQEQARDTLRTQLLPLARLVTPNLPETEVLTGKRLESDADIEEAAARIADMGPAHVLVKGGHGAGPTTVDLLYSGGRYERFAAPRIDTPNTHGTGCTFSAAIAAYLAKGLEVSEAVKSAKAYLAGAIEAALPLGSGHGPLRHFWNLD